MLSILGGFVVVVADVTCNFIQIKSNDTLLERFSLERVESNLPLLWFCITMLSDWFKNLAPVSQLIRSKTKTNRDSLAHVFPRFAPAT